ncbi:hypothetical protein V2J09_018880 [Rumex salicifolius]
MDKTFQEEEVKDAMFQMRALKAPGLNGFQPLFFQHCWDIVGKSVCRDVKRFFENGEFQEGLNHTLIVLIAKVAKSETIAQFRLINLCNVFYKLITKVTRPLLSSDGGSFNKTATCGQEFCWQNTLELLESQSRTLPICGKGFRKAFKKSSSEELDGILGMTSL